MALEKEASYLDVRRRFVNIWEKIFGLADS